MVKTEFSNTELCNRAQGFLVCLHSDYGKMLFLPSQFKTLHLLCYISVCFTVQEKLLISILVICLCYLQPNMMKYPSCLVGFIFWVGITGITHQEELDSYLCIFAQVTTPVFSSMSFRCQIASYCCFFAYPLNPQKS